MIEIPLHVGDNAVFVQADGFGYIKLISEGFETAMCNTDFRRLNETEQGRIVAVLGDDMLAEHVIFQPNQADAHKVNALVFACGEDFSCLAGVCRKVPRKNHTMISATF